MSSFLKDIETYKDDPSSFRYREAMAAKEEILAQERFTVDSEGVMRWKSNNRIPPREWIELAGHLLDHVSFERCVEVSQKEDDEAIEEYIRRMADRTPEEIAEQQAEARAAFGEGVEVVNMFTKETFMT